MLWDLLEDAVSLWLLLVLAPAAAAIWAARGAWTGINWARDTLA
jgi:hypothetical protein